MTQPKNHRLQIRLTTEEHEKIQKKADMFGLEISSFIRLVALRSELSVVTSGSQGFLNKKTGK